ncbi:MAG TPA: response regulator transcription factor [Acidimicrobiales bacterium]|nr:response regulator transcription factor [Acidimicrobiales bacterium]
MRVLVVEDSVALADVVAEGLRAHGIAVDVAYDGVGAACKLALTNYHVVVLDRTLPGLDGDELCQQIARNESRAMVLMLSGAVTPDDRVAGLELGADDYLGKPFHFRELLLRVRALARRQPEARGHVLRWNDVELDPLRHRAVRAGRPLELSAKEFAVLEALLRSSAVLSAEELLAQAWDEHADPFTNTVAVTIGRLRQKLGAPPVIETVPRVGYRLCGATHPATAPPAATPPRSSLLPGRLGAAPAPVVPARAGAGANPAGLAR